MPAELMAQIQLTLQLSAATHVNLIHWSTLFVYIQLPFENLFVAKSA